MRVPKGPEIIVLISIRPNLPPHVRLHTDEEIFPIFLPRRLVIVIDIGRQEYGSPVRDPCRY